MDFAARPVLALSGRNPTGHLFLETEREFEEKPAIRFRV